MVLSYNKKGWNLRQVSHEIPHAVAAEDYSYLLVDSGL